MARFRVQLGNLPCVIPTCPSSSSSSSDLRLSNTGPVGAQLSGVNFLGPNYNRLAMCFRSGRWFLASARYTGPMTPALCPRSRKDFRKGLAGEADQKRKHVTTGAAS